MQISVLSSASSWYLRDLQRAAGARHDVTPLAFRDLVAELTPDGPRFTAAGADVGEIDALIVRTMPPATLEQVVMRMDLLGRLEASGVLVVNPPRALEAAVDKYLTSAKLQAVGLETPHTIVCQTVDAAMSAFERLHGDVVIKPLFGGEGRGIARLNDEAIAQRTFSLLTGLGAVLYVQQFIPHDGYDLRILLVGERSWAIRRRNVLDWRTNVSRGAIAEHVEVDTGLLALARKAAAAIGAQIAGVDFLPGKDGKVYAIEVNAVPGWQALGKVLQVDVANEVIQFVERQVEFSRLK